ncbi:cyclin-like protein interacting with PHO85 [Malassezia yamatoensis]|uniref:Cyclin-like protein interacting with PHO85 n=1 Tax=Malassezia yamatoensis TaxID=253288 RepID=A0AAJ5YZF4_9BASI|nr:cyclin-like protein interacting with PHO85 [Malassezia yamatoensis]
MQGSITVDSSLDTNESESSSILEHTKNFESDLQSTQHGPSKRPAPSTPESLDRRTSPTPLSYTSSQSVLSGHRDSETPETPSIQFPDPLENPVMDGRSHLDIANYPSTELLKMLAALLQHITTSNDQLRPSTSSSLEEIRSNSPERENSRPRASTSNLLLNDPRRSSITTAALSTLNAPSSTLCFHARHIPSISIEAYLLRILKYCPTTNDVFLSLLVYFDRMSRVGATGLFPDQQLDLSQSTDSLQDSSSFYGFPGIRGFAIDSYNIHRLIIAGITVASKFFSDVFYTNARYAKVGGLAVHELNQLELHFLLLTDFRLTIPISEIQQYGDQLLAYATSRSAAQSSPSLPISGELEVGPNAHMKMQRT